MLTVDESPHLLSKNLLAVLATFPDGAVVAFSGGVDSAVVAAGAFQVWQHRAVAVTADSASVPRNDIQIAKDIAQQIGIRHIIVGTNEFENENYLINDGSRCFHCKTELYSQIQEIAPQLGISTICSGANQDDLGDYRPGLLAAQNFAVRHPLQEAGLGKQAVRAIAKLWQLPIWDRPASPCLSSRIVPGLAVTPARTQMIELAEQWLREKEIPDCRVRLHHDELARVEIPVEFLPIVLEADFREKFLIFCQNLGFRFVTFDLAGLRSGSMNELISLDVKNRYQLH
ncbi:MAG: ATP-dependent sacrificial sulfur transferase LarE [Zavarzinella sp.]